MAATVAIVINARFVKALGEYQKIKRNSGRTATMTETSITVESCLAELQEMFPDASFISAKTHAIYQRNWTHRPQADVQVEDKGFRRGTLAECMTEVRAWKESQ